jgi:hypothetical protein
LDPRLYRPTTRAKAPAPALAWMRHPRRTLGRLQLGTRCSRPPPPRPRPSLCERATREHGVLEPRAPAALLRVAAGHGAKRSTEFGQQAHSAAQTPQNLPRIDRIATSAPTRKPRKHGVLRDSWLSDRGLLSGKSRFDSWRGHVATSTATGHPVFHPAQEADEPAPDDLEIVDDREADRVTGRRVHV